MYVTDYFVTLDQFRLIQKFYTAVVITSNGRPNIDVVAGPPTSLRHRIFEVKWPKSGCRYRTEDLPIY